MLLHHIKRIIVLILSLLIGFACIKTLNYVFTLGGYSSDEKEILFSERTLMEVAQKPNSTNEKLTSIFEPEITLSHPFKFLINPEDLCSRGTKSKSNISLLILISTIVSNSKEREAIRNTWGSVASASKNTDAVRLAFLLGWTKNETAQKQLEEEASNYSDIIQEDFVDSYGNLTIKSVMLLKWTSEYCPNVQFVMKTDDDMYVNVQNLVNSLERLPVQSNVIYGQLLPKSIPVRDPTSKWFISKTEFDGDVYPDYLSGTGYVMSRDVTPKLLKASAFIPFFRMEDVFLTGMCASYCQVKRLDVMGFSQWERPATGCAYKHAISGHHVATKDMYKIWWELNNMLLLLCF